MKKLFYVLFCGAMLAGLTACEDTKKKDRGDGGSDGGATTTVKAVDLGLPSGLKWGDRNLGAAAETGYGNYYAWGETKPKTNYDWSKEGDYKWGILDENDANYGMTKYNSTDQKYTLEPADDAATATLGTDWHIPTTDDINELFDYCDWEFTIKNKVAGYEVTGSNGNSIFLPLAGIKAGTTTDAPGEIGFYWTADIHPDAPYAAIALYIDSVMGDGERWSRYNGLSIRPVTTGAGTDTPDDPNNPDDTTGVEPPVDEPIDDIPYLPTPGSGYVTIAIHAQDACYGLYLAGVAGAYPGTYEGLMYPVSGTEDWYQITCNLYDVVGYSLKALLLPEDGYPTYNYEWIGDGNVEILSGNEAYLTDDYGTANALVITEYAENSVIYIAANAFKSSPCLENEVYTISVIAPELCEAVGGQVYLIGGFNASNWDTAIPMTLIDGYIWQATIEAQPNTEFKIRGNEYDWSIEVVKYDEEWGGWTGTNNLVLTYDKYPLFDLSSYSWNVCVNY